MKKWVDQYMDMLILGMLLLGGVFCFRNSVFGTGHEPVRGNSLASSYVVPDYAEITSGVADVFLPESLSVMKLVDNKNVGKVEVTDADTALKILASIDGAKALDLAHPIYRHPNNATGSLFADGYIVCIIYKRNGWNLRQEDVVNCPVFALDGDYYVWGSCREGYGIGQVEEGFYNELANFFPEE